VTTPTIGVLALQGDVREHLAMLGDAGARTLAVRRPRELDEVDGIVMPGGESTTMWRLARTFELIEPLRRRLGEGLPSAPAPG
jgi:5'-phosphate synthase pdxT subunit